MRGSEIHPTPCDPLVAGTSFGVHSNQRTRYPTYRHLSNGILEKNRDPQLESGYFGPSFSSIVGSAPKQRPEKRIALSGENPLVPAAERHTPVESADRRVQSSPFCAHSEALIEATAHSRRPTRALPCPSGTLSCTSPCRPGRRLEQSHVRGSRIKTFGCI